LVVGSGHLAVELVGELISVYPDKTVTLVTSQAQLIPYATNQTNETIRKTLENMGIQVMIGMQWDKIIKRRGQNIITFKNPKSGVNEGFSIRADLILWGENLHPNLKFLKKNFSSYISPETGKIKVNPFFQLEGYSNIFAIGCANDFQEHPSLEVGLSHATHAINNIKMVHRGKSLKRTYSKQKLPELAFVSVGPKNGFMLSYGSKKEKKIHLICSESQKLNLGIAEKGEKAIKIMQTQRHYIKTKLKGKQSKEILHSIKKFNNKVSSEGEKPKRILILSGTHYLARNLAETFLANDIKVRLAIHFDQDPDIIPSNLKEKSCQVVTFNLKDPESMRSLFSSIEHVILTSDNSQNDIFNFFPALVKAIKPHIGKVKHILKIHNSNLHCNTTEGKLSEGLFATEKIVKDLGIPTTFIRFTATYQQFWRVWGSNVVAHKSFFIVSSSNLNRFIDDEDLMEACLTLVIQYTQSNEEYDFTVSEPETIEDVAQALSNKVGEEYFCVSMPPDAAVRRFGQLGFSPWFAEAVAEYMANDNSDPTQDLERVLGRKPKTFSQWIKENAKAAYLSRTSSSSSSLLEDSISISDLYFSFVFYFLFLKIIFFYF